MRFIVLCDFDGTITMVDTAEYVLGRFAVGDWRTLDRQFERGEIALEECLRRQFKLVRASEKQMLDALEGVVSLRPHFSRLVQHCKSNSIPLVVLSAGLDFVIGHYLRLNGWSESVAVCAAKARATADGVEFVFPPLHDETSVNFKQDLVRSYRKHGETVVYIGDGSGDFDAAKEANRAFAVQGSKLAQLCQMHRVPFKPIADFQEVINGIQDIPK
jgi:2-hydroxy-3-keto-5-methylthiopentenyl-1-phosphate phosphatase